MGKIKRTAADEAFSNYIRTRDKWTCQRCGKVYNPLDSNDRMALHCSHFKGRGKASTRFDPLNCDALCYGCHSYFGGQPDEHLAWQIQRKGQEVVDDIILRAMSGYKKVNVREEAKYWREQLALLQ